MADRELPSCGMSQASESHEPDRSTRSAERELPDFGTRRRLPVDPANHRAAYSLPLAELEPSAVAQSLSASPEPQTRATRAAGISGNWGVFAGPAPQGDAITSGCGPYSPPPIDTTGVGKAVAKKFGSPKPTPPSKPILPVTKKVPRVNGHLLLGWGGLLDEELQQLTSDILNAACDNAVGTGSAVNPAITAAKHAQCVADAIAWGVAEYEKKLAKYKDELAKWDAAVETVGLEIAKLEQYFCEWLDMVYTAVPAKDLLAAESLGQLPFSIRYGDVPEPPEAYEFVSFDGPKKGPEVHSCGTDTTFRWSKVRGVSCSKGTLFPETMASHTKASWYLVFHFTKNSMEFYDSKLKPLLDKKYLRLLLAKQWQTMLFGWDWNSTFDSSNPTPPLHKDSWIQMIPYYGQTKWQEGFGINWAPVLRTSLLVLQGRAASLALKKSASSSAIVDAGAVWVLPWGCQIQGSDSSTLNKKANKPNEGFQNVVRFLMSLNSVKDAWRKEAQEKANESGKPVWEYMWERGDQGGPTLYDWPVGSTTRPPSHVATTSSAVQLKKLNDKISALGSALVSFTPKSLGNRANALPKSGPPGWLSQWYISWFGAKWIPSMSGNNVKKSCSAMGVWKPATKPVAWPWWWTVSSPRATFLHIPLSCVPAGIGDGYSCLSFENGCKTWQKDLKNNSVIWPSSGSAGYSYAPFPCIYF